MSSSSILLYRLRPEWTTCRGPAVRRTRKVLHVALRGRSTRGKEWFYCVFGKGIIRIQRYHTRSILSRDNDQQRSFNVADRRTVCAAIDNPFCIPFMNLDSFWRHRTLPLLPNRILIDSSTDLACYKWIHSRTRETFSSLASPAASLINLNQYYCLRKFWWMWDWFRRDYHCRRCGYCIMLRDTVSGNQCASGCE